MKKIIQVILLLMAVMLFNHTAQAQCRSYIQIDGNLIPVDPTSTSAGFTTPAWLTANETLAADQNVNSISVMEFNVSGTTLTFSRVLQVTTSQPVPSNAVWKIESIFKKPTVGSSGGSATYNNAGSNTFTIPSCVDYICVSVWGPGGGGGGGLSNTTGGGGGGGGGYAQGCYKVTSGTTYNITIGTGGNGGGSNADGSQGGTSTVSGTGINISASGGSGGSSGGNGGTGGSGGTSSTGAVNVTGGNGTSPTTYTSRSWGGAGGNGANGGNGAPASTNSSAPNGSAGTGPGGGGSGAYAFNSNFSGGAGAAGQVTISW